MPSGDHSSWISKINLAMAGVEAGVLGGLFMMLWLAMLSALQGRSVWSVVFCQRRIDLEIYESAGTSVHARRRDAAGAHRLWIFSGLYSQISECVGIMNRILLALVILPAFAPAFAEQDALLQRADVR